MGVSVFASGRSGKGMCLVLRFISVESGHCGIESEQGGDVCRGKDKEFYAKWEGIAEPAAENITEKTQPQASLSD